MNEMQKPHASTEATQQDISEKVSKATPDVKIKIHRKDGSYAADPPQERQHRGGDVVFYNKTSDDVELRFFRGTVSATPFTDKNMPYLIAAADSGTLTVEDKLIHKGVVYTYTIKKQGSAYDVSSGDGPRQQTIFQKCKRFVFRALALTSSDRTGGSDPEMIID